MTYDLRLTVPTEEEIKGLSVDEILALFSFDKADAGIGKPPRIVFVGESSVKSILYWEATGNNLVRPINASGNLSAAAQYSGLNTAKLILYEGSLANSLYTFESSGLFLVMAGISMSVNHATNFGDIIMGKNASEKVGMPVVLRDISSWGCSGVQFQLMVAGAGDTLGWYSQYTTGVAATVTAYYVSMMVVRLAT